MLPMDWQFRTESKQKGHYTFLDAKGVYHKSFIRALNQAEADKAVTEEEVVRLKQFVNNMTTEKRKLEYEWQEDKSLPPGWKIRSHSGKVERDYVLSPAGGQFPNRRTAIIHMFEHDYPR